MQETQSWSGRTSGASLPRDEAETGNRAMTAVKRIAVVDDEADIRETIEDYLAMNGYEVRTADGGEALRALLEQEDFDLVLLDISMPGEDGLSLARHLRANSKAGVVMLTASGTTVDRIVGLEMGADDYIVKPFDLRELLARVRAVIRRVQREEQAAAQSDNQIAFGNCLLNLDSHKLFDSEGKEIAITSMEFDLLKAFAEHPNRVLNRDQLLDLAHNRGWEPFDRSIDIRIARIRRKIEAEPSKPEVIKTVRGAGYIFVPRKS